MLTKESLHTPIAESESETFKVGKISANTSVGVLWAYNDFNLLHK